MAILLRYNGQVDKSYNNRGRLKVGDVVRVIKVYRFNTLPASVYVTKDLTSSDWHFGADLNCFDYVPKREHPQWLN